MIDPRQRAALEWKLMQIAFEFQDVSIEDAAEMLRLAWVFAPQIQENMARAAAIKQTG